MRILGVIPARYASSRLPGKPLADIQGKPMIQWVYEACKQAAIFDELYVATDDTRIKNAVYGFRGDVIMTAASHRNGTERVSEALQSIEKTFDVVINIQGDEPFLNPNHLFTLAKAFRKPEINIASLYRNCDVHNDYQSSSVVKVVTDESDKAIYFSRAPIPYHRDTELKTFKKHIGLYAFRPSILPELIALPPSPIEQAENLEQLRWIFFGHQIQMLAVEGESLSVDTADDLEQARQIAKEKI